MLGGSLTLLREGTELGHILRGMHGVQLELYVSLIGWYFAKEVSMRTNR